MKHWEHTQFMHKNRSKDTLKVSNGYFRISTSTSNATMRNFKDLNVFVPNESDMKGSMSHFFMLYSLRKRTDREFWLLDASAFETPEDAANWYLKDMSNLDLDDDFYLYEESGEREIRIYEYYEINSQSKRILQLYGFWNEDYGLQILNPVKWSRRSDFKARKSWTTSLNLNFAFDIGI